MRAFVRLAVVAAALACHTASAIATQATAGSVSGTVTGGSPTDPLPGATVTLHRTGQGTLMQTTSARDGKFAFEGVPAGTYSVDFDVPGFHGVRRNGVIVTEGGPPATADAPLQLHAICECVMYSGPSGPSSEVTGTITDDAGRPITHALLEIRGGPLASEQAYSGPNGEFVVRLAAGRSYTLTIRDSAFLDVDRPLRLETDRRAPVNIRLTPRAILPGPGLETLRRGCRCEGQFNHKGR